MYFVWIIHHAINDGWSMRIVLDTAYKAYRGAELPTISPYTNLISYVSDVDCGAAQDFWTSELEGARRSSFPSSTSKARESVVRVIDITVSFSSLRDSSITMATVLRTAWAMYIPGRYSEAEDVCYGATISGRQAAVPGLLTMPGAAITTVPVRVRLDKQKPASNLLHRIQTQAMEMTPYEQYGLSNISKLDSDARDACDFASLLVIQPREQASEIFNEIDGLLVSGAEEDHMMIESMNNYFNYPLVMLSYMCNASVNQRFLYNPDVLTEAQVQALSHQFDHIIQQL